MQIGELNNNLSGQLRKISTGGEPVVVDYYGTPRVTLTPPDLFEDLLKVAGKRGQEVLKRHREDAEQRKHGAVA